MSHVGPPEKHFFLFYRWPRQHTDELIRRIAERFTIRRVIRLQWSRQRFFLNVRRFYAHTPEQAAVKRAEMDEGPFLLVIVDDCSPRYRFRLDGSCTYKKVNLNAFELKHAFRQEGLSVHTTDTEKEFYRDIIMLLGVRGDDLPLTPAPWDGTMEDIAADVAGANGWRSLSEIFQVLNEGVRYVVLRSFEKLPRDEDLDPAKDIDLLVEDSEARRRASAIVNAMEGPYVQVGEHRIHFDLIEIEDCWYDPVWARKILADRILTRGFFTPTQEDYFFSLIYRACIHKSSMPDDYLPRLVALARDIDLQDVSVDTLLDPNRAADLIGKFLRGQQYHLTQPRSGEQLGIDIARRIERVYTLVLHDHIQWREQLTAATRRQVTDEVEARMQQAFEQKQGSQLNAVAASLQQQSALLQELLTRGQQQSAAGSGVATRDPARELEQRVQQCADLQARIDRLERQGQSRRWLLKTLLAKVVQYPRDLLRRTFSA